MTKDRSEYQSRVIDDAGLTRGRVPSPLLRALGARPGDRLIFRPSGSAKAIMLVLRPKPHGGGNGGRQRTRKVRR